MRNCCCAVRRNETGGFNVFAYQEPPIRDFYQLAVSARLIKPGTHLAALQHVCSKNGLSSSGWAFVSKFGHSAFKAALHSTLTASLQMTNALALIEWQAAAQLTRPMPFQLADILIGTMGVIVEDLSSLNAKLARAVCNRWAELDESSKQQFAEQDWVRILVWMKRYSPQLDKNQWRAGWPAITRKYRQWFLENSNTSDWSVAVEELTIDQWRIRALDSEIKLTYEALAMRHCLASYVVQCQSGDYLAFSITNLKSGRPVATLGIEFDGLNWQVDQVKGKLNATPPDHIVKVAHQFADHYQQVSKRAK